ncbi:MULTISPECIES: potassium channel family protein [Bacteroidota]|uniref:Potassium transporter TrkA n=2 Tax=Chryseobacterium group TaxID=2782232 RepID=A0A0J7IXB0_9FLAO|nr:MULTISPECIES: TrkA family potassium uptake protein [Bacteroidota]KMQ70582.1 potassium transporter TrkA [Chryseobacterium koreense CCUG 49689]MBB5334387.1 trk system potassium uptake protein TrkA [Chryseobacterium koreense]SMP91425.1 trk system potassium uptake protein TrkA [Epilithonimonas pallida]
MKFIIIGLGNFGGSLAEKLTQQGNEVIGVDSRSEKVVALKDKLSHTICMNATDQSAITHLPLKNTDIVMVCIGEDEGANIMVTAHFKNLGVKRLISRAINPLHESVLQAIGVNEIVRPEEETAERWAKKLCLKGVIDSFELNKSYSIVEIVVPEKYIGKTIEEVKFRELHNVLILTIIRDAQEKSFLGRSKTVANVQGIPEPTTMLQKDDIIVIYGNNEDLQRFAKVKYE